MKTAIFVYKCRHCRKVYRSTLECGEECAHAQLVGAVNKLGYPNTNQNPVPMLEVHKCTDTEEGIAKLVGYTLVD